GDFKSDNPRTIFAFGTDEMAAGIEHHDGLRHLLEFARLHQRGVDNARSLSERYRHSCSLLFLAAGPIDRHARTVAAAEAMLGGILETCECPFFKGHSGAPPHPP